MRASLASIVTRRKCEDVYDSLVTKAIQSDATCVGSEDPIETRVRSDLTTNQVHVIFVININHSYLGEYWDFIEYACSRIKHRLINRNEELRISSIKGHSGPDVAYGMRRDYGSRMKEVSSVVIQQEFQQFPK